MCKYCKNLYSGNSSEILNRADISANSVFMGSIISSVGENEDSQPTISSVLMNNQGEVIASDETIIGWCPVCGRRLTGNV